MAALAVCPLCWAPLLTRRPLLRSMQVGRAGSAPCGDYKLDEVALPPPPPRARAAAAEVRREVAGLGPRRWNNCTSSGHGGRHADASELLSTTTDAKVCAGLRDAREHSWAPSVRCVSRPDARAQLQAASDEIEELVFTRRHLRC